jgi:integrase
MLHVPPRRIDGAGYWLRGVLVVVAVAHRRLGPSSSATTSTTERALPSSAVQLRCWSRPTTTTRLPLDRDSAACSAWSRHTTYRVRYRDPAGGQRSKIFARKADAQRFLNETETAKARGTWTDPSLGRVLFRDWLGEWWATTTNLRASTRERDESLLRRLALPSFGDAPLAAISQRDVRAWVADLSGRGLAPATVQKAYQLLGKVMGAAVDAGMLAQSPCRRVPLPKVEREEMQFLTPAEVATLADAIQPRYRALVLVGAYGGLRIGELAGLRRSRVDLLRGTVQVAEIVVEVRGVLHIGPPKTRASRRTVGLPRFVVEELAAHLAGPGDPEAFVFTAPEGGPLRVHGFRARVWRPATLAAGLDGLRIHDLRHTAVALWIAAGANPKEVSARAGHTSVSFTLDRYGHLYPEADSALRDRLDTLYGSTQPAPATRVIRLPERPRRGPSVAPGAPKNDRSAAGDAPATP